MFGVACCFVDWVLPKGWYTQNIAGSIRVTIINTNGITVTTMFSAENNYLSMLGHMSNQTQFWLDMRFSVIPLSKICSCMQVHTPVLLQSR